MTGLRKEAKIGLMAAGGVVFVCALLLPFLLFHHSGKGDESTPGIVHFKELKGAPYAVESRGRLFFVGNKPTMLLSAGVHYPRLGQKEWEKAFQLARNGGFNMITSYLFWNLHEPEEGMKWFMEDEADFMKFIKLAGEQDLFVHLRVGPYVCAEWNLGGLPAWLRRKDDMKFRSMSRSWREEMSRYLDKVMKQVEPLLARNGGPIILAQIENEFADGGGRISPTEAQKYVEWCVDETTRLKSDIPWTMCVQDNAPAPVIATCNGYLCADWLERHCKEKNQPCMWTEHWSGWFRRWGDPQPSVALDDLLYEDARWFAAGGLHRNFYMFQGGTNFGRAAAYMISQSYDYAAPIDEFGVSRSPRYDEFAQFQKVLGKLSGVLTAPQFPQIMKSSSSISPNLLPHHVIGYLWGDSVAFLVNENVNKTSSAKVTFDGINLTIRGKSVIIVDRKAKKVLHATAKADDSRYDTSRPPSSNASNSSPDQNLSSSSDAATGKLDTPNAPSKLVTTNSTILDSSPATSSSKGLKYREERYTLPPRFHQSSLCEVKSFRYREERMLTMLKADDPSLWLPESPPVYYEHLQSTFDLHNDTTDYTWYLHKVSPRECCSVPISQGAARSESDTSTSRQHRTQNRQQRHQADSSSSSSSPAIGHTCPPSPDDKFILRFNVTLGHTLLFVDGVLKETSEPGSNWHNITTVVLNECPKKSIAFLFISMGAPSYGNIDAAFNIPSIAEVTMNDKFIKGWWHYPGLKELGKEDRLLTRQETWERPTFSQALDWLEKGAPARSFGLIYDTPYHNGDHPKLSSSDRDSPWHASYEGRPCMWYRCTFSGKPILGSDALFLSMWDAHGQGGLQKGNIYMNGHNLGRYWNTSSTSSSIDSKKFEPIADVLGGSPMSRQNIYHVPKDWVKPGENELIIFEHIGGSLNLVRMNSMQASVPLRRHHPSTEIQQDRVKSHPSKMQQHPNNNNDDDNAFDAQHQQQSLRGSQEISPPSPTTTISPAQVHSSTNAAAPRPSNAPTSTQATDNGILLASLEYSRTTTLPPSTPPFFDTSTPPATTNESTTQLSSFQKASREKSISTLGLASSSSLPESSESSTLPAKNPNDAAAASSTPTPPSASSPTSSPEPPIKVITS